MVVCAAHNVSLDFFSLIFLINFFTCSGNEKGQYLFHFTKYRIVIYHIV